MLPANHGDLRPGTLAPSDAVTAAGAALDNDSEVEATRLVPTLFGFGAIGHQRLAGGESRVAMTLEELRGRRTREGAMT